MREHHPGVDAGVVGQERGEPVRARRVEQAVGAPLGDRPDLGDRDREEVADQGERRPVEVAARLDAPVGEHHRVVDRRSKLGGRHLLGVGKRVTRGART